MHERAEAFDQESAERAFWWQAEALQAERRARAHARLESAASSIYAKAFCPAVAGPDEFPWSIGKRIAGPAVSRFELQPARPRWRGVAPASASAPTVFTEFISGPVVQAKCVTCHVEGGVSGHTRLVLVPSTVEGHVALNLKVFEELLSAVEGAGDLILNKIQGVGHGGGIQVAAGSADFANMEQFLRLLGGETTAGGPSPRTLFDGVTMASPARTLRRAALIFAGRIPTQAEINSVSDGRLSSLRRAIRGLMTGLGFHEFLIRASNDRLLTDRHRLDSFLIETARFPAYTNLRYEEVKKALAKGYSNEWEDSEYHKFNWEAGDGFARASLELIAHVVENDLPYTEILTADYIMANPTAAAAYGASTKFSDPSNRYEFKPSRLVSYYRDDDSKVVTEDANGEYVVNPGNLSTEYPHAGVLNTTVFLARYPSTATNRNRARARWTYYHFLGLDVEKSASRTTDPAALADTDNPTMKNPACTVCHSVMDPVAGAFQNYGDNGYYRDGWHGLDSLPNLYKYPKDGTVSPYRKGDTWYRSMREAGFGGEQAPSADNSVQWLAERIAADERFAEATVKFWWPGVTGVEVTEPPEDERDADFAGLLLASNAQAAEVRRLAAGFREGFGGGPPYNLKDLLVELALSPWFRAESLADRDPVRMTALRNAGMERMLTPEELAAKTDSITGYSWGRLHWGQLGKLTSSLDHSWNNYRLLYGGIDSDGITTRSGAMTPIMAAVAQSHAAEVSCPIVLREFYLWPEEKRRLFGGVRLIDTPVFERASEYEVTAESPTAPQEILIPVTLTANRPKNLQFSFLNFYKDEATDKYRHVFLDQVEIRDRRGRLVSEVDLQSLPDGGRGCRPGSSRGSKVFAFYGGCSVDVPIEVTADGPYDVVVAAHQSRIGDENARLGLVIESDDGFSHGAVAIREKLVELHDRLYGATVAVDSPEVDSAFELFEEVWSRKRATEGDRFFDGQDSCQWWQDISLP